MKRAWMAVSILVLAAGFVGCKKAEPPSPIVKKGQDTGSGEAVSGDEGIHLRWFNKRWKH
jgi:hypothetical protein